MKMMRLSRVWTTNTAALLLGFGQYGGQAQASKVVDLMNMNSSDWRDAA
jgi:hypothetical protein